MKLFLSLLSAQDIPSDCIAGVSNSRYSCASLLGANLAD